MGSILGLFLLLSLLWQFGCNYKIRHKILRTVFDEVPPLPEEIRPEEIKEQRPLPQAQETKPVKIAKKVEKKEEPAVPKGSVHPPWADKECDSCHDFSQSNRLVVPAEELCPQCHPDKVEGEWVHGPVAIGECQACHEKHESSHPHLLKKVDQALCLDCHDISDISENTVHEGVEDIACYECHEPHAGKDFLK